MDTNAAGEGPALSEGLGPLPKTNYTLASGGSFTWVRGWSEQQVRDYTLAEVQRAVAAERERCALVCESVASDLENAEEDAQAMSTAAQSCADQIRAGA